MDGFINLNKPLGYTSHDALAVLRKTLGFRKIGHSGTLDPGADGVLPVCLGKATRLADYIAICGKKYRAEVVFGITTDSYDADGQVLSSMPCPQLTREQVAAALPQFVGLIQQVPPMVSALKKNGQPLYLLARQGITVERAPRAVSIDSIEILRFEPGENPSVIIDVACGKGTYIRSLAHDLGVVLGMGASLRSLTRLKVGEFELADSYTLEEIALMKGNNDRSFLLSMNFGLSHIPVIHAPQELLGRLLCGNSVQEEALVQEDWPVVRVLAPEGKLLGIGHTSNQTLFMDKVLVDNKTDKESEMITE